MPHGPQKWKQYAVGIMNRHKPHATSCIKMNTHTLHSGYTHIISTCQCEKQCTFVQCMYGLHHRNGTRANKDYISYQYEHCVFLYVVVQEHTYNSVVTVCLTATTDNEQHGHSFILMWVAAAEREQTIVSSRFLVDIGYWPILAV